MSLIRHRPVLAVLAGLAAVVAGCGGGGTPQSSSPRPGETGTSYLVTVSRQPGGTVTSADGKINCGTAAAATACGPIAYAWSQAVTLTAKPDAGKMFGTWAGDCVGRTKVGTDYVCVLDTTKYGADKYVVPVFGEVGRTQHPNFNDPAVHGPEFLGWVAKKPDTFECTHCHGSSYDGLGIALSCNKCHATPAFPNWRDDCTFCHAAPPVGEHPAVSSSLAGCAGCHVETVASDGRILPAGKHMDGTVQANGHADWTSPAIHGPKFLGFVAKVPGIPDCTACHGPTYSEAVNDAGESCSGCHADAGFPNWLSDCTFCHAAPPAGEHPSVSSNLTGCASCHAETVDSNGALLPGGSHMDGSVQGTGHADWTSPELHGPEFFGFVANAGASRDCTVCHGTTYGNVVNTAGESCNGCHTAAGWTSWRENCSFCHGEKNPQSQLGLYDLATNPMWSAPATGAHAAHLVGARFSPATPCTTCHTVPTDVSHIGGVSVRATVSLTSGAYDVAAGKCSTSCHGSDRLSPAWADGQVQCGTCHGLPPATTVHAGRTLSDCSTCHSETMRVDGTLLPGGKHIDGIVQKSGGHSDYTSPAVHGPKFFGFLAGEGGDCRGCHGATDDGGFGPSCNDCHEAQSWTAWQTNCSFCHGEKNAQSQVGGYSLALNPMWSAPATGAHQAHLVGGTFASGFKCETCHAVPVDLSHIGGTAVRASVALNAAGQPLPANLGVYAPSASAADATCTTYCHGTAAPSPTWSTTGLQCGACHGLAPATPNHPSVSSQVTGCATCHPDTVNGDGTLYLSGGAHIDGQVQVERTHEANYRAPAAHGPDFLAYLASGQPAESGCKSCHGATYGGGSGPSCNACHASAEVGWTSWQTNCSFCHGAKNATTKAGYSVAANPTWSAPPDTVQQRLDGVSQPAVAGGHAAHLTGAILGIVYSAPHECATCHTVPAGLSHVGGAGATVTLSRAGRSTLPQALGTYTPSNGSCTTYCHGTTLVDYDGNAVPPPTWGQKYLNWDCSKCHGYPPASGPTITDDWYCYWRPDDTCHVHQIHGDCSQCHPTDRAATHVNGIVEVTPQGGSYDAVTGCSSTPYGCHGYTRPWR